MSLSNATHEPNSSKDAESAKERASRRDRLGKNLLSLGEAVIVTNAHGNVILLNPAAESLTGWTDSDARDRPIEAVFRIIHEVTRQPVVQPVKEVIEHGVIQSLAQLTLLVAKDGSERAIDDSAAPLLGDAGDLDGVVLIFRDTTERREQEKQRLADARHHNEVIIAIVQDTLVVLDAELRVRSANRSFYETFKTSPPETIGRSLLELGNAQWNIAELRALLDEILTKDRSSGELHVEQLFPVIGLRNMVVDARKLHEKAGTEKMILLAIEDITERKRLERSLAASEQQFRRLFETAHDGILILDGESGTITDANPFMLELLSYSRDELLGKQLWQIGLLGDENASRISFQELQARVCPVRRFAAQDAMAGRLMWSSSATFIASTTT